MTARRLELSKTRTEQTAAYLEGVECGVVVVAHFASRAQLPRTRNEARMANGMNRNTLSNVAENERVQARRSRFVRLRVNQITLTVTRVVEIITRIIPTQQHAQVQHFVNQGSERNMDCIKKLFGSTLVSFSALFASIAAEKRASRDPNSVLRFNIE
jgi:hypothetical protein